MAFSSATHRACPPPTFHQLPLANAEASTALAHQLAPLFGPGDVLCLEGDLGAGKTHMARGIIQARLAAHGQYEDVPSPSFTLVQSYEAGDMEIWHSDLYRLSDPFEVDELGLIDAFDTAFCLIEWPDRLGAEIPSSALWLSLTTPSEALDTRHARFASHRPAPWRARFAERGLL